MSFRFATGKLIACLATALVLAAAPQLASAFACGAAPSTYFDGEGGKFDDFNDSSGYPVFNKDHCYGNAIFSTTGKDSFTSGGFGRKMTNSGYGYQCFELAERYFLFKFNKRIQGVGAADLCDNALPQGTRRLRPGSGVPAPGDLFVFPRGTCGSSPEWGHIAVVTKVWNPQSVQVAQQNMRSEKFSIANVKTSCACAFIHADDNLATNGPWGDTPNDAWEPGRDGGEDGPMHTNGGNLISDSGDGCRCKSSDPTSIWPLCCMKK